MSITPTLSKGKTGTDSINAVLDSALTLQSFDVDGVPSADENEGKLIHVSDGDGGSPCLAYSNGTDWLRILIGAAVAGS